jgi:hypothetical protein
MIDIADTPITMGRNKAVMEAREYGADLLLMVDSDMWPDHALDSGDVSQRPFWDEAFEFCYKNYAQGPHVVGAPYCGPPPNENVYVFKFDNNESDSANPDFKLAGYGREETARLHGIRECGALPTGLILFDMRAFELTEPKGGPNLAAEIEHVLSSDVGRTMTESRIKYLAGQLARIQVRRSESWFYYEWIDDLGVGISTQSQKGSTEDVTATRDIAFMGIQKLGYNPLHCAWSSWAGHWKPKCVGRPQVISPAQVSDKYRAAMEPVFDDWEHKPPELKVVRVM